MNKSLIRSVVAALLALNYSGCLDIVVRTTVSADGSSERVVTFTRESQSVPDAAFPIPRDSSWSVRWREIRDGQKLKYEYTARKRFASPEQLTEEYATIPDTAVMDVKVRLGKSFQWFYSYVDYEEVYTLRYPYSEIPVADSLTKEEIEQYQHRFLKDSIIDRKVQEWSQQNEIEFLFRGLVRIEEKLNDPEIPPSVLMDEKERTIRIAKSEGEKIENNKNPDLTLLLLRTLEQVHHTKAVYRMRSAVTTLLAENEEKQRRLNRAEGTYENSVQFPGVLLETNSNNVEGNLVKWKVDRNQLMVGRFVMKAQSRTTNVWAFIVTGSLALVAVALVAVQSYRKQQ